MEQEELLQELLNFLDSMGMYKHFIDWELERGYDEDELERIIEELRDI